MINGKERVIFSIDLETTGDSYATGSVIMVGIALCKFMDVKPDTPQDDFLIEKKVWCISEIPGKPVGKRCWNEFWSKNPLVWNHIKENQISPQKAMLEFNEWYVSIKDKYLIDFVARPSSWDWQWFNSLYDEFGPHHSDPDYQTKPYIRLPFSIICITTIIKMCEKMGIDKSKEIDPLITNDKMIGKKHFADDDAISQAYMYARLCHWIVKRFVTV